MPIHIHSLQIPYIPSGHSDIWGKEIHFAEDQYYHIKASSGKGKSTFIQCLYGVQKNYSGELSFNGQSVKNMNIAERCHYREQSVSIVFQDLKLFEHQTAFENIEIKRQLNPYHTESRMKDMAIELGVSEQLSRPIDTLSYGERQRIAIIRALMQPFQMLLLDEPFSHLDQANIQKASALILHEVRQRKAGIILVDLEDDQHFPYHEKRIL
ncbi:MAG: ATP-binding cassette domain-containing protein [Chitinophagaceae bacterium]|nr:ATP-binding cassette domain-containing protein [Chitinophagaceae bacterium]